MSTPGSHPPDPAPSARAVGEERDEARAGSKGRAMGLAGRRLRPRGPAVAP